MHIKLMITIIQISVMTYDSSPEIELQCFFFLLWEFIKSKGLVINKNVKIHDDMEGRFNGVRSNQHAVQFYRSFLQVLFP